MQTGAEELTVADFVARTATAAQAEKYYGKALLRAAKANTNIVCLTADLTLPTETDLFRDEIPDRFFQVGIAEANMIGIAGGMARSGDVPFVHSFCAFATRRCYDQIAMQIAYPKLNVKVVGVLPGLSTLLGVSHQAIDDIALMRALPNMVVIEPSGPSQVRKAVAAAARHVGPVYLRMKRADGSETDVGRDDQPFEIGKMRILREGADGLFLGCGMMVPILIEAAEWLELEGYHIAVADVATIKPLDPRIAEYAAQAPVVITAENHSVIGGLGSAVAELLMEQGVNTPFARIGVKDVFAEGGSTPYLFERYGLTTEAVISAFFRERVQL